MYLKFNGASWEYLIDERSSMYAKEQLLQIKNDFGIPLKKMEDDGTLTDMTDEEIKYLTLQAKKEIIREKRGSFLKKVDYLINEIVLFGLNDQIRINVADYRQQLLDITENINYDTDIDKIEWPTIPKSVMDIPIIEE